MCVGVKYTKQSMFWVCENNFCFLTDEEFRGFKI
jgi:hypothetical protein